MKCPTCNVDLLLADKQGIEIDYCPTCRGIWLDRGELEKLVERIVAMETNNVARPANMMPNTGHGEHYSNHAHHERREHHGYDKHHYGKRESVWHKLFDF